MKSNNRLIADIPSLRQIHGIRWLVLEEDIEDTGGWYLYAYQNLNKGPDFDSWYLTRSEAQQEAKNRWDITEADWKSDC